MNVLNLNYYERLRGDFLKHGSLFVAFDYDNTVFDYHNIGVDYSDIVNLLRQCRDLGFTLILFTGNEGERLDKILDDLRERDIPYDLINENPIMNTRKPYYNILLDDRAGLVEAYGTLKKLVNELRNKEV